MWEKQADPDVKQKKKGSFVSNIPESVVWTKMAYVLEDESVGWNEKMLKKWPATGSEVGISPQNCSPRLRFGSESETLKHDITAAELHQLWPSLSSLHLCFVTFRCVNGNPWHIE